MAIDFNRPNGTETSTTTFRSYIVDNMQASLKMLHTSGNNIPIDTVRRRIVTGIVNQWQKYNGASWDNITFRGLFDFIGVGTDAPLAYLHTHGPSSAQAIFERPDSGACFTYWRNSDSVNGLYVGLNSVEQGVVVHKDAKDLLFGTDNTTRMTIAAAGDISMTHRLTVGELLTANAGLDITGNLTTIGYIDGRDVATDGENLDAILAAFTPSGVNVTLNGNMLISSGTLGVGVAAGSDMGQFKDSGDVTVRINSSDGNKAILNLFSSGVAGWKLEGSSEFNIIKDATTVLNISSSRDVTIPNGNLKPNGGVDTSGMTAANLQDLKKQLEWKQYDLSLTDLPANWEVIKATGTPYQTSNGLWKLKFNIRMGGGGGDTEHSNYFKVDGIILNGGLQTFTAVPNSLTVPIVGLTYTENKFFWYAGFLTSGVYLSGDIEINSKPSAEYFEGL